MDGSTLISRKNLCLPGNESGYPRSFSNIILKLLAKDPGERYQSAGGLLWDIRECQRQWTATGKITPFAPGRMDFPARLTDLPKLYGRKKEAAVLRDAFDRACAGQPGLVLVHGYAGVGKTALVKEIIKPLALEGGIISTGNAISFRTGFHTRPWRRPLEIWSGSS